MTLAFESNWCNIFVFFKVFLRSECAEPDRRIFVDAERGGADRHGPAENVQMQRTGDRLLEMPDVRPDLPLPLVRRLVSARVAVPAGGGCGRDSTSVQWCDLSGAEDRRSKKIPYVWSFETLGLKLWGGGSTDELVIRGRTRLSIEIWFWNFCRFSRWPVRSKAEPEWPSSAMIWALPRTKSTVAFSSPVRFAKWSPTRCRNESFAWRNRSGIGSTTRVRSRWWSGRAVEGRNRRKFFVLCSRKFSRFRRRMDRNPAALGLRFTGRIWTLRRIFRQWSGICPVRLTGEVFFLRFGKILTIRANFWLKSLSCVTNLTWRIKSSS